MSEEPASKYDAMKKLPQIPRATLYRKVARLHNKGFLRVVKKRKFKKGNLEHTVELLDIKVLKGYLVGLGCNIDFMSEPFEWLPETDSRLFEVLDPQFYYDFLDGLFDFLIEIKEDLTDKEGDFYLLFHQFALKKPEVVLRFLRKGQTVGLDSRARYVREMIELNKLLKKKFAEDI